jgi:FkbM family methyltransferase
MEGTLSDAPVLSYVTEVAAGSDFILVDIGCSGGIDPVWRRFGRRLRALAIDPNLAEIERLRAAEADLRIEYVAAFAGLPPEHAFALRKADRGDWGRNPWDRLSVARSIDILKTRELSNEEKTAANLWPETELADTAQTIVVPDYLRGRGVDSVDFLKIDIDGKDFDVLNSFDEALDGLGVLGLGLEVNFFGSDQDTDHTFHNTDRFLKARGYELFNLTVRRYSAAALPSHYRYSFPAQSEFGRPLQGDAVYIRDLGSPEYAAFAARLPPARLLNLVCIFAIFNLPDCAAEIALRYRDQLSTLCDIEHLLDLLVFQVQQDAEEPLTYRQYMERFDVQDAMFYPGAKPLIAQSHTSELTALRAEIESLKAVLSAIERSKFWKLRRAWVKLKSSLGLVRSTRASASR